MWLIESLAAKVEITYKKKKPPPKIGVRGDDRCLELCLSLFGARGRKRKGVQKRKRDREIRISVYG